VVGVGVSVGVDVSVTVGDIVRVGVVDGVADGGTLVAISTLCLAPVADPPKSAGVPQATKRSATVRNGRR
jgi:hypothetical protein